MKETLSGDTLYASPFHRGYWKAAVDQLRSVRALVLAANIVAVRVVLTVFSVPLPIGESLYVSLQFLFDALGSLIYGPVVGVLSGAVTDILAYLIAPRGPYFFPFTLTEMLGSLIYALFLFRARVSIPRAVLPKLTVNAVINILLTPVFLSMMYGKAIGIYLIPRIAKNLCLLPLESLLLTAFLTAVLPVVRRLKLIPDSVYAEGSLKFRPRHLFLLAAMLLFACGAVFLYYKCFL